ncbi:MAG: 8-amino-7-oxononanoate synthase [Planctomycetota bacterium]|nr:8-amino-7-oxononanoate synthase [Planctomycetota bacterium]MDA1212929.1 8-amino-7-oxononanoate synthase [Planctomycetota bacterium]
MSKPLPWLEHQLAIAAREELLRVRRVFLSDRTGGVVEEGVSLRNFAGNDYLNLAHDPQIAAAVAEELKRSGAGATASSLVIGRGPAQRDLEECIAAFEEQEGAIVFPSGYAANLGSITALVDSSDVLFCDRFNHASLVDGCRLSGARLRVYRHDDLTSLQKELKKSTDGSHNPTARKWIVTESVFSMDGDVAPLKDLCDLAERYGAEIIVDEAHATGVYGTHGRGVVELAGVEDRIAVRIGTMSKALGAQGGFAVGAQSTIDWLWNNARTQMFSTSLSPLMCAAAITAIQIIQHEPERRRRLHDNVTAWREAMSGDEVTRSRLSSGATGPIQPVHVGEPGPTLKLAQRLKEAGLLIAAIRPPTVPQQTSRLRISFSSAHTIDDITRLAAALSEELDQIAEVPHG